jgi:hypothetical protein
MMDGRGFPLGCVETFVREGERQRRPDHYIR